MRPVRSWSPSLRTQIVLWYSLVLLIALSAFVGATYLLLRQALQRTGEASVRQTAQAVEQVIVPRGIPRLETREQFVELQDEEGRPVEALLRHTVLATGDVANVVVPRARTIETRALRAYLLIALLLVPLTAAAAALGGLALVGRILGPLHRLVSATREIGIGDLSRRVQEPDEPAELRRLAQSFNGMLIRLERAVATLRRFSADASHELRTPLTSIKGTVQVALARKRSTAELEETLEEVLDETEWMLHLVEGLLTLARGEEQSFAPHLQTVDLRPLLAETVETGRALASDRPIDVRLVIDTTGDLAVRGSPAALRQILINLITNAVKFTERGSVTVEARPRAENGDAWVEVAVRDTGIGIPADELPRVFDRFYRGEAARARQSGTGLGLAIASMLVDQLGGSLAAESAPGAGSVFRVRLQPAPPPSALPAPA